MAGKDKQPDRQQVLGGFEDDRPAQTVCDEPARLPSLEGQTVYVIDSFALIYQVFFAMPSFSGPNGQPVGAVHGFVRDMADVLEHKQPEYLFCTFDASDVTFRHEFYPEYKMNRDPMPDDLRSQVPEIQRMLSAMGIPVLQLKGYEADDIMATLACQVEQRGGECVLVTSDKDCRQLITNKVRIYNIRKDSFFAAQDLQETWGIRPDQVVDFQSLVGDSVDNVPGVPQIGPKTARELLEKYDTLEGVLENADQVTAKKRRENLLAGREQAMLSRRLVELDKSVPIEIDWAAGHVGGLDSEQLGELCDEFGFRRLKERLLDADQQAAPANWEANYQLITTEEQLDELVSLLATQQQISIDTETTGLNPRDVSIIGYSFCWQPGEACYVPVMAPEGDPQLDPDMVREKLRGLLEDPQLRKIGQNLKYDMVALRSEGVQLRGLYFDTMVADYLDQPGLRSHSLDELSRRYLNHVMVPISDLIGKGKKQIRLDQVDVTRVGHYAAEDADVPMRIVGPLEEQLKSKALLDLFREVEMPLVEILAELQFNGIRVDAEQLEAMSQRFSASIEELLKEIHLAAGREFNVDSRKELSQVLFEELLLPVVKRTKTGPSTDVEVLTELSRSTDNPLPGLVIRYRQLSKLKSTYVDALPLLVHPETGRVHSAFNQNVAATGRLSSTDPNLQNIPVRTTEGREIRRAFQPQKGWKLLAADYSQIELRVLAHFSADSSLLRAFEEGVDIHSKVASEVYGKPLEEVDSEMRRRAKAINFGVIYGQSAFGLAKALDIDQEDASAFIEAYFAEYPGVEQFFERTLDRCFEEGFVKTALGRRRPVEGVRPPAKREGSRFRNLPERIAINTVIQGSAADLIKQAMVRLHTEMRQRECRSRMLLQIHDELMFEVPAEEEDAMARLVESEMIRAGDNLDVPLVVDLKMGPDWASCESWDEG